MEVWKIRGKQNKRFSETNIQIYRNVFVYFCATFRWTEDN